jgi:hypothetical protein
VVGQVGDLGFASELGNYAEYSGAPNEEETLQYARALIDVSAFWTLIPILDSSCRSFHFLFSIFYFGGVTKDCVGSVCNCKS